MKKEFLRDFINKLPENCLFDKGKIGCGGTSLAIECEDPFVIAVPFISLVENKVSQYPNKRREEPILGVTGDTKVSAIKAYLNAVKSPKFIVTYDSLGKLTKCLNSASFRLLVDEYHLLFGQYSFRSDAVNTVFENYKKYKSFCFMTATPLDDEFVLEELKGIPIVRQEWPDVINTKVQTVKCLNIKATTVKLVKAFLDGELEGNAYLFVNSVDFIKQIISAAGLTSKNTRVIYSKNNKKQLSIENSSVDTKPKKINFLTSTVFEGTDIYDPDGRIVVISDPSKCQTLLDISTSIQQIAGRIRNSKYIGNITHLYSTTRYTELTYEEFLEESRKTEEESKRLIQKINDSDKEVRDLIAEKADMSDKYIKKNKENSTFSFDSNLVKVDLYNYKVVSKTYSVRVELSDTYKENGFDVNSLEDGEIKFDFNKTKEPSFKDIVKQVKSELEKTPRDGQPIYDAAIVKYPFLKEAIEKLGFEKIESLKYCQKEIKDKLLLLTDKSIPNKIAYKLNKIIQVGSFYSKAELKKMIQNIYDSLEISDSAKAKDIEKYYNVKPKQKQINGEAINGYLVVSKQFIFK